MEIVYFLIGSFAVSMCLKRVHFRLKQYLHLLLFYILFLNEFYNNLKIIDVRNTGKKEVTFTDFFLLSGH